MLVVMLQRFEDKSYLMPVKNGHSFRLLEITNFAAWETEYEHGISSLVLAGRQFQASRNSSFTEAFSGHVRASLALNL
jgi:hypothetical protein